ncbi:MAG: hypothetical protein PVI86_14875 [Phycisphaerae bacterium]
MKAIVVAVALGFGIGRANAQSTVIFDFDFGVDGVLPTATDPGVVYRADNGTPEASVYSVMGGVLQQRLFGVTDNSAYIFRGGFDYDSAGLSPEFAYSWEVRLEAQQIEGSNGTYFDFANGTHRYVVSFGDDGLHVRDANNELLFVDGAIYQMRTYRLESQANSNVARLFIDEELAAEWNAPTTSFNGVQIASGSIANGTSGDIDWDHVRFSRNEPVVPATSDWGLAVMLVLVLTAGTLVCRCRVVTSQVRSGGFQE